MKRIIYTQRVEVVEAYQERRDCADQRIADFIYKCGYLPIPVPNDENIADKLIEEIQPDGILLTGGNSLVKYGGNAPERDAMDRELIRIATEKRIPLYGFCRGMQSILDYFGNELVNIDGHVAIRHFVYNENNEKFEVNSYHNQACVKIRESCGLKVISKTADNVIEEICHEEYPMIGTMWHPERESEYANSDIRRIRLLFN